MTNNMTVFAFPQTQTALRYYTYERNGENPFEASSSRFVLPRDLPMPTGSDAIHPTKGFCVVNRAGANGGSTLDIFIRTQNNDIRWNTSLNGGVSWNADGWKALDAPGVTVMGSAPAASSYGNGFIVLVTRGSTPEGKIYRRFYSSGSWNIWQEFDMAGVPDGVTFVDDPAVIGTPANSYRVYARASNNKIYERQWNGTTLTNWQALTYPDATSSPEGVDQQHSGDQFPPIPEEGWNLFYRGTVNQMRLGHFIPAGPNNALVSTNYDWAGGLTSGAGAVYFRGPVTGGGFFRELHTFVKGNDNMVYGRYAVLNAYGTILAPPVGWYKLPQFGTITGKPDAVTWL